ncbi:MAG: hypothetical protein KDK66_07640 [Deltaproteobacteria bacterium]|nr:hypothetical protein [Deltaproteobacteria bacterium]
MGNDYLQELIFAFFKNFLTCTLIGTSLNYTQRHSTKVNYSLKNQEVLLRLNIKRLKGGEYLVTSASLLGLIVQDVGKKLIESYQEYGNPLMKKPKKLKKKPSPKYLEIPLAIHA